MILFDKSGGGGKQGRMGASSDLMVTSTVDGRTFV